jgi:Raf kinase inhibitor-like YbhB/YbcL family protein
MGRFTLISKAFTEGKLIPVKYTCDGEDISPPLMWQGAPEGVVCFAIDMFDPDAPGGGWVHWVMYNIPRTVMSIDEGTVPPGSKEGLNDFGRSGYGGPCPPPGKPHRYVFSIYALDANLGEVQRLEDLKKSMSGHILAEAKLTGLYQRGL